MRSFLFLIVSLAPLTTLLAQGVHRPKLFVDPDKYVPPPKVERQDREPREDFKIHSNEGRGGRVPMSHRPAGSRRDPGIGEDSFEEFKDRDVDRIFEKVEDPIKSPVWAEPIPEPSPEEKKRLAAQQSPPPPPLSGKGQVQGHGHPRFHGKEQLHYPEHCPPPGTPTNDPRCPTHLPGDPRLASPKCDGAPGPPPSNYHHSLPPLHPGPPPAVVVEERVVVGGSYYYPGVVTYGGPRVFYKRPRKVVYKRGVRVARPRGRVVVRRGRR